MTSQALGHRPGGIPARVATSEDHQYFRGIFLGYDSRGFDPDSDASVLGLIRQHKDHDNPNRKMWPLYGYHWTSNRQMAVKFSLDPSHGQYRYERLGNKTIYGAVIEAHSAVAPAPSAISEYGEQEIRFPHRDAVTKVMLHLYRLDPSDQIRSHREGVLVRSFEIPEPHWREAIKKVADSRVGIPLTNVSRVEGLESERYNSECYNATVVSGAPLVYRGVGDVRELELARSVGYWTAEQGGVSNRVKEGDTQFTTDFEQAKTWASPYSNEDRHGIVVEADISGMPVRFMGFPKIWFHQPPNINRSRTVMYPNTAAGIGVVGHIPLSRIKRLWVMKGGYQYEFSSWGDYWKGNEKSRKLAAAWNPVTDPDWDEVPTPANSVFRYRRKTTENGLYPEVCKARGSSAGTWYSGSAYDAATGLSHRQNGHPASEWRWPEALAAALQACQGGKIAMQARASRHLPGGIPVTVKQADANTSGVMVALIPDEAASQALIEASNATEEIEEQHITLLYLGSTEEAGGDVGREKLHRAVYDFAINSGHDVLSGTANGWGVFNNDDEHVLVALWDIPDIAEFRAALKASCSTHGVPLRKENHGFTPHSTMRYENEPVDTLPDPVEPQPTSIFTHVVIAWGDEDWVSVALGSLDRTADFDEGKHPRGQPGNAGEFSKTPGGAPKITEPAPTKSTAPDEVIPEAPKKKKGFEDVINPKVRPKMIENGDVFNNFLPAGKFDLGDPRNNPEFEEKEAHKSELSDKYSAPDPDARNKKIGGNTQDLHDHNKDPESDANDWYDKDRHDLHNKILDEIMERAKKIPHDGKCLILAGPSGAGKTTFLKNYGDQLGVEGGDKPTNYITINPDDFKDLLPVDDDRYPGLNENEMAGIKHEESSYLAQRAAERLMATGVNVIMDITMSSAAKAQKKYVTGHEDKYTYQTALIDGDMKNSLNNAGNRWKQTDKQTGKRKWDGRFVPMSLVMSQKATEKGYRSVNAQEFVKFAATVHCKRTVVFDPYDDSTGLQDVKQAIHEAIRQGGITTGMLVVIGGTMKTTEITQKIKDNRSGKISDDALVKYLSSEVKYQPGAVNPYDSGTPEWWKWSEDGKPYVPGSFAEVDLARDNGLLDSELYEKVLEVFYSRQT